VPRKKPALAALARLGLEVGACSRRAKTTNPVKHKIALETPGVRTSRGHHISLASSRPPCYITYEEW
jgi:hypothetical protein